MPDPKPGLDELKILEKGMALIVEGLDLVASVTDEKDAEAAVYRLTLKGALVEIRAQIAAEEVENA